MADTYEIIQLRGDKEWLSQHGKMFDNFVTVASEAYGEEQAKITTKKQGVLRLGDTFEATREEGQYGLKLKRLPPQQGPRPLSAPRQSAPPREEKPPTRRRSYNEIIAAYRQFHADTGEKTHATTLLLSWLRGEFDFEPAADPDGPPEF